MTHTMAINEGLSAAQSALEIVHDLAQRDPQFRRYVIEQLDREVRKNIGKHFQLEPLEDSPEVVHAIRGKLGMKRGPRQKGDRRR